MIPEVEPCRPELTGAVDGFDPPLRSAGSAAPVNLTLRWASVLELASPKDFVGLSPSESDRATRIADPHALAHFVTGCRLLRSVVHQVTLVRPESVRIDRNCPDCGRAHGRPQVRLLGPMGTRDSRQVNVSLSHVGDWVVAVACVGVGVGVGIDIEERQRFERSNQIPNRVLHPNEQGWSTSASPSTDFLRTWVRKESLVKARGEGLRLPLSGICLSGCKLLAWDEHPELIGAAVITDIEAPPGVVGALAVLCLERAGGSSLRTRPSPRTSSRGHRLH